MTGSGFIPGSSDTPHKRVDINVNVNVSAKEKKELPESTEVKPRCTHGNYVGECLTCWRLEAGDRR